MNNGGKILAAEFFIAIMFSSWGAIKWKYAPWPANYVKIGVAFSILGLLSMGSEKLASLLGAGFMMAILVREMSKGPIFRKPNVPGHYDNAPYRPGALSGEQPYMPLYFGDKSRSS